MSARLRAVYGVPLMAPHQRPLDELVLTVLSQSTSDRNRDVAFLRLRARFGAGEVDWAAVRSAPVELVEEAIRPGRHLARQVGAHPGHPAESWTNPARSPTPRWPGCATRPWPRLALT